MLNSNIKMDLHIHSFASCYKEPKYSNGDSIVKFSTIENIEILLNHLLENGISLFSITDHNRYDFDLYKALQEKLKEQKYDSLHLLHGIEFDVKMDENKSTLHIIAIFDVKNIEQMTKIKEVVKLNELIEKNDCYKKDKFESILKDIGLDTILIVHQRCSLDNKKGNHNSLSEAVEDPYTIAQVGYINALEYHKPNVEGILKNNLRNVDYEIALVTGSDCHDWNCYPKHDKNAVDNERYFSKCKILPTFKGLLLGLTSPKSRFNRKEIQNTNYIDCFKINDETVQLDPGINVIIGENGSGKSTLFNLLCNDESQQYIKKLKKNNNIIVNTTNLQFQVVKQAELIQKFQNNDLFQGDEYFKEVDTTSFENEYNSFSSKLKLFVEKNIQKKASYISLNNKNFILNLDDEVTETLYVNIEASDLFEIDNTHTERRKTLGSILNKIISEYNNEYYENFLKQELYDAIKKIKQVYDIVLKKEKEIELQNKIKNIILREINSYNKNITELSTSRDQEIHEYKESKSGFISDIVNAIKLNISESEEPNTPSVIQGNSVKRYNGYVFGREANFNNVKVIDKFFEKMFVKDYRTLEKVMSIKTKSEFVKALLSCSSEKSIDNTWGSNYEKFLQWAKEQKSYIKEESTDDSIGNTLGEMSLIYYKFQTNENDKWDILMIDQPEDNISNNRIAEKLLNYFHILRKHKQLILVTHNPLLVVNLDVDNVIALNKVNNTINVKSGCLEDEENSILDIVADTLDGGKDMIEKRLKIYGKEC